MFDYYYQLAARPAFQESLEVVEADIQHANMLAASIPRDESGACLQMKYTLTVSQISLHVEEELLLENSTHLSGNTSELDITQEEGSCFEISTRKKLEKNRKIFDVDMEREDECGICLEPCTKMVVPDCCHAMCINCYHNWNARSESCPFCRGSLKRVNSGDLWVLTCGSDVVDAQSLQKKDMLRFSLYINSLPRDIPDAQFLMYYEYLL